MEQGNDAIALWWDGAREVATFLNEEIRVRLAPENEK
jgi:hypothetical protein